MTSEQSLSGAFQAQDASLSGVHAGAMLRDAREAAGLSLDTVSDNAERLAQRVIDFLTE